MSEENQIQTNHEGCPSLDTLLGKQESIDSLLSKSIENILLFNNLAQYFFGDLRL